MRVTMALVSRERKHLGLFEFTASPLSFRMKCIRRSLLVISLLPDLNFGGVQFAAVCRQRAASVGCKRLELELPLVNRNLAVISSQLSSNDNRSAAHTCITDSIPSPPSSVSKFICKCLAYHLQNVKQ